MEKTINPSVSVPKALRHHLHGLTPISLKEMNSVKLLNRIDRKFIIPINFISDFIQQLRNQYYILEIDGRRLSNYGTTYYDTPDLRFYQDHHNGLANRIKVRCREYVESKLRFFEIKVKSSGKRTNKFRLKLDQDKPLEIDESHYQKIRSHYKYPVNFLTPTIINTYRRITLVNKAKTERCTIDLNIAFKSPEIPDKNIEANGFAIIELKQSSANRNSPVVSILQDRGFRSKSISKYVLGIMLAYPEVKRNAFKPLLLTLNKISKEEVFI